MKICHVTSVHPLFDTRIFYKECRSLAQAGHSVTLVAPAECEKEAVDGVHLVHLPPIKSRTGRPRLWGQIVQHVRRMKPDLVHLHDPELLLICALLRPARLVYDCHEPYAETVLLRDWIPRPVRRPLKGLVAVSEPILAAQTDAILVTEESHAIPFRRIGRLVVLVRNFPLLSDFDLPRCSDGKTVIHVGINSEPRGSRAIIEAARRVVQSLPDARFVIVGDFDPPAHRDEIEALVARYGLERKVLLVGRIPYASVPQWLAQADVGLVPWLGPEQFPTRVVPTKLFEYMGAGLPVVASDLPTIRRFAGELDCGFLVEPGNVDELAARIEHLLNHPDQAREKGQNGRRAVGRDYHWGAEGETLLELYSQLAA